MKKIKFSAMNKFVAASLAALFFLVAARGEVRSGFWTHIDPSGSDSIGTNVDFSALSPFCQTEGGAEKCSLKVTDCYFKFDTVFAPNGIYFDSSMSADLQTQFIKNKKNNREPEALFYLDSMMKKIALKVPQATWRTWIRQPGLQGAGAFFVKTGENRYAFMLQAGLYIGGIDRIWYYWAYQPDSGDALYKNRLIEQPDSIKITVDVFSGRQNPVYVLKDSAAIFEITHAIYASVDTFLDPSVKRIDTGDCPSRLGYKKLSVEIGSAISHTVYVCGGKICSFKIPPLMSSVAPLYYNDKNSVLERLVIRVGCEKNLNYTDQVGAVPFCSVIPDSLKPATAVAPGRVADESDKAEVKCCVNSHEIRFQLRPRSRVRVDCFGLSGNRLASVWGQGNSQGVFSVDLRDHSVGNGAYIVKLTNTNLDSRSMVFPVFIYR